MFLNILKNISLKKILRTHTHKVSEPSDKVIHTIGLLIDGSRFEHTQELLEELRSWPIIPENIRPLVYTKNKQGEHHLLDFFRSKDIGFSGDFSEEKIKDFTNTPFDLLISYYDKDKANLNYLTARSKADFKVGLFINRKHYNHFMIDVDIANYKLFTDELYKYLKILNKI